MKNKKIDSDFIEFLEETVKGDLGQVTIPKNVLLGIKRINEIREDLVPEKIEKYLVPELLKKQTEINGLKYLISSHLSTMKGTQSHAFIFRKFQTASEYNPVKKRLEKKHPDSRPTVGEIGAEIEKGLLDARRTEIAFQVAGDKLECILDWCDKATMIIQNRLRDENTDKRTTYAGNNSPN